MSKPLIRFVPTGTGFLMLASREAVARLSESPLLLMELSLTRGVRDIETALLHDSGWKVRVERGSIHSLVSAFISKLDEFFEVALCKPNDRTGATPMELEAWAKLSEQLLSKL